MRRVVLVGAGFLLMLAGVVFTLQGVGVLGGSVMSGVSFWAVAGPVIMVRYQLADRAGAPTVAEGAQPVKGAAVGAGAGAVRRGGRAPARGHFR